MTPKSPLFGLFNLHKPPGLSSRQVVDRVVPLVKPAKAGHAGTLDPLATGVLIVCVGPATRLISLIQEQPKVYRGRFQLGCRSDTDDRTGHVVNAVDARPISREVLLAALPQFLGEIQQVPPQFSAMHVQGKRAYQLARAGQSVEIAAKTVTVHRLELLAFDWPLFELEIECGSGTYVRSLGRDLGEVLGCGAMMTELVRTRIGPFDLADAVPLEELTPARWPEVFIPPRRAVEPLPAYVATDAECQRLKQGLPISWKSELAIAPGAAVAILTETGELAGLAESRAEGRLLIPRQVFLR